MSLSCMVPYALSPPSLCVFTSTPLRTECQVVTLISSGWGSVSRRVRKRKLREVSIFFLLSLRVVWLVTFECSRVRVVSCVAPRLPGDIAPGDHFNCTLSADPAACICYAHMVKRTNDGAAHERSAFLEQWAAMMYCNSTTATNCHPFVLQALVLRNGVPVSEDQKCQPRPVPS
jgi:hypothetical protein